jgi:hypothetical protein
MNKLIIVPEDCPIQNKAESTLGDLRFSKNSRRHFVFWGEVMRSGH